VGYARPTKPAAGGANGFIMVGMFVCLCLASKKPSEREFFVPAGTELGVKLLTTFGTTILVDLHNSDSGFTKSALSH
jgi:hypothetical protein